MTQEWPSSWPSCGLSAASDSTKTARTHGDPADCGLCGRGFKDVATAEIHLLEHYGWKRCKLCGEAMPEAEFKTHQLRAHSTRQYRCECGAAFFSRYLRDDHVARVHVGPWFGCSTCLTIFKKWDTLVAHCEGGVCAKEKKKSSI